MFLVACCQCKKSTSYDLDVCGEGPTGRSISNSRHLGGNQWVGRRCVKPHDRGFGCWGVTPGHVCFLRNLITSGWDGSLGDHTRPLGLRQGTTVCVHTNMDVEQLSDRKLMTPSEMGSLVCAGRVAPLLSFWCARGNMPTGVNLNRYSGSGSCVPWHSDNESFFGPPNLPKLKVSMSLGHSVVFQVRRVPGDVPSPIELDHGDLLVVDGQAQSGYAHRTVRGLQGPRVNLAYRWVAQHTASCPLAGVVGCVFPTCVQGLAEPGSRWLGMGGKKWSSFWELVLLLLILVSALLVRTWIHIRRGPRYSGQRPSRSAVYLPSPSCPLGSGDGVGDCHDVAKFPRRVSFYFFPVSFVGTKLCLFSGCSFFLNFWILLDMLVANGSPPHATVMHIRWVPLTGHIGEDAGKPTVRPRFLPCLDVFFFSV